LLLLGAASFGAATTGGGGGGAGAALGRLLRRPLDAGTSLSRIIFAMATGLIGPTRVAAP
jgi:hypothetical protein